MTYKNDINEQMKKLLEEYKGSANAEQLNKNLERIMELNKPLIHYTINMIKYKAPITRSELETICYSRLWEILNKFDPDGKISFTNYVVTDLKFVLINYIREMQNTIKIPHGILEKNSKIRNLEDKMLEKGEIHFKDYLENGFTKDEVETYKRTDLMYNFLEVDKCEATVEDTYEFEINEFENQKLKEAYENLRDSEKELIRLITFEGYSFAEIARKYNCTRQNIKSRHSKAIKKLRKELMNQ